MITKYSDSKNVGFGAYVIKSSDIKDCDIDKNDINKIFSNFHNEIKSLSTLDSYSPQYKETIGKDFLILNHKETHQFIEYRDRLQETTNRKDIKRPISPEKFDTLVEENGLLKFASDLKTNAIVISKREIKKIQKNVKEIQRLESSIQKIIQKSIPKENTTNPPKGIKGILAKLLTR